MSIELSWMPRAAIAVWLSVIFTLYLAPSREKYEAADMLAAALLVLTIMVRGARPSELVAAIKPLAPLLLMTTYVLLQGLTPGYAGGMGMQYALQLLYGLVPYLLFYLIFRHRTGAQADTLLMAVLIIPGVVHIAYMYLDVFRAIQGGEVAFLTSSKFGLMEYVKDAPRVGRRYLSMALLHLLGGGLLLAWHVRVGPLRYLAWILAGLSVLSLALLDARAAYVSMFIGALLLAWVVGPRQTWQSAKQVFQWRRGWKLVAAGVLIAAVTLGYSAGKSRWVAMAYSFDYAVHDVFHEQMPLSERPYVDRAFWNTPIDDIDECYREENFRCRVDQSAYLRMAWLLSGVQSLVNHPLGIGYTQDYMGRLWGVAGDDSKYQRNDSFLVEHVVSFGWPAIVLFGWLFWGVMSALRRALRAGQASAATIMLCAIVLACVGRAVVDVFSEGLWKYLMALMGIYFGLLHANGMQPKKD